MLHLKRKLLDWRGDAELYSDDTNWVIVVSYTLRGREHGGANVYAETLAFVSDSETNILDYRPIYAQKGLIDHRAVIKECQKTLQLS